MSAAPAKTQTFRISVLLRRVWPMNTAKMAAQTAHCSVRTSQKWLAEICDPSAETLIRLAQGNAALRTELIQILEGAPREVISVDRRMAARRATAAACGLGSAAAFPEVTAR